ncbi:MAG: PaaI family thioesterase [Sphingomonadaceae bacterium]|nr:PaaI family thioesterase [Sphingomonadaceae bacterium]
MIRLPPYGEALGIEPIRDEHSRLVLKLPFGNHVSGRPGFLHGGAIAGLLEIAGIMSLYDQLGEDDRPQVKPITVTTDFMRNGFPKMTYAAGIITRSGRRMANVESFAWQDDESKPIAASRMNLLLVRK